MARSFLTYSFRKYPFAYGLFYVHDICDDIIVFNRPDGGDRVIVHRIIEIENELDGDVLIQTKGEANPSSISGTDYLITKDDYIGIVMYVIPRIGLIAQTLSPPVNYIIIAIKVAIFFITRMGKKVWHP